MGKEIKHLEDVLYNEIPLTRAMGVNVVRYTGRSLVLGAPLVNNTNHKCTAFGGSLYSIAVLAGWGLLYLRFNDIGLHGHIVIRESRIKYIRPVDQDISAVCELGDDNVFANFIDVFKRKGIAKIKLEVRIDQEAALAVRFQGDYVIQSCYC